jgi:hypothetical protein
MSDARACVAVVVVNVRARSPPSVRGDTGVEVCSMRAP